jgi:hypothetical protein
MEFPRPSGVSMAVALYSISLVLGIIDTGLLWDHLITTASLGFILLVQALIFTLLGFLTYKIWRGRNWARIASAVLYVVGLIPYIPALIGFFRHSTIAGSINLLEALLQLFALYLVFLTPARRWFKAGVTAVP